MAVNVTWFQGGALDPGNIQWMDFPKPDNEPLFVDTSTFVAPTLPANQTRFAGGYLFMDFYFGFTEQLDVSDVVEFDLDYEPILIWDHPTLGPTPVDSQIPEVFYFVSGDFQRCNLRLSVNNRPPAFGTTIVTVRVNGVELENRLHVTYTPEEFSTYGPVSWYMQGQSGPVIDDAIISKIYLDSGEYEISVNGSTSFDLNSYINTPYGQFIITPIKENLSDPTSIEKFQVKMGETLVGEVFTHQFGLTSEDTSNVAMAMSSAIDIVTNKVEELIEQEERALLAVLAQEIKAAVDMSDEQKAILRTYIIESGLLPDILDEMANPTDILGLVNGA